MDKRHFDEVVKQIKGSNDDVDKVLDAAQLQRHEGPSRRLSADQKSNLLWGLIGLAAFAMLIVWLSIPVLCR